MNPLGKCDGTVCRGPGSRIWRAGQFQCGGGWNASKQVWKAEQNSKILFVTRKSLKHFRNFVAPQKSIKWFLQLAWNIYIQNISCFLAYYFYDCHVINLIRQNW